MQENYINIFTSFLAELLEAEKMKLPEVVGLVKVFEPAAPYIDSRERLIKFVSKYTDVFPDLNQLIVKLEDPNYNFNLNIKK